MKKLIIDPAIVAPWQVGALEVFKDTWEHVLSSALMYGVKTGRRGFADTEALYKSGRAAVRRFETETLVLEAVIQLVAEWVGMPAKGNADDAVMAWAADPSTGNVIAADRFAKALFVALSNRPQLALPL